MVNMKDPNALTAAEFAVCLDCGETGEYVYIAECNVCEDCLEAETADAF